ncbi:YceI family protein [Desertimonas flava]|uniref:YceI family protein n=1 Tax=Desertimonas flava TaxID=2064846 RepID=UPI000E34DF84|nr:YceI family protein [Desertimonas flava]
MFKLRHTARLAAGALAVATLAGATASTTATATAPDDSAAGEAECATGATTADSAASESAEAEASGEAGDFAGVWVVAEGSEVGYRVPEELAGVDTEAVGRGTDVAGSFTVVGDEVTEACIVVEVATITSDEAMRDGQFTGRIMETSEFPTATFVITEPLSLDDLPEVGGEAVTVGVTGELTLHGVTNEVSFDAQVQAGEQGIGLLGEIPIVFEDYAISNPSGGPAQVGDEGSLEVLLLFAQA